MSLNLITEFIGDVAVSQNKYNTDHLNQIIADTEERILKDLLGDDLYHKFIDGLALETPPDIYVDLRDGLTYKVYNKDGVLVNVKYEGVKKMLRYFTFAEIIKFQDSENTDVGQVEPNQSNSNRVAKNQLAVKIENAYNKGVALYGFDIENYSDYITNPIYGNQPATEPFSDYEQKRKYDYYKELIKPSCYNFLYKYKANYPTWTFSTKDKMFLGGYL